MGDTVAHHVGIMHVVKHAYRKCSGCVSDVG
jgi:hypothetical protein